MDVYRVSNYCQGARSVLLTGAAPGARCARAATQVREAAVGPGAQVAKEPPPRWPSWTSSRPRRPTRQTTHSTRGPSLHSTTSHSTFSSTGFLHTGKHFAHTRWVLFFLSPSLLRKNAYFWHKCVLYREALFSWRCAARGRGK